MSEPAPNRDDLVYLQDLVLLQQARSIDLGSPDPRTKSRDRLQRLFVELQKVIRPEVTLEIGAHAAMFSRRMPRLGAEAHAFEANPYTHQAFAPMLAKRAPDVRYRHLAISDVDGEVTFQVKESRAGIPVQKVAGNNSLMVRSDAAFAYEEVTVPSTRLDSYLKEQGLQDRQFSAWIDVEGALGRVTAGFGTALQSCASLIVEVEEVAYWQGQMLYIDAMRYFASQGLVPVARDFEARHQFNMVYLRGDVLVRPAVRQVLARYFKNGEAVPDRAGTASP